MNTAQKMSSGQIQFSEVRGHLFEKIEIADFQYNDSSFKLTIKQFHLNWQISDLLNKKVTIDYINATGINYIQLTTKGDKDEKEPSYNSNNETSLPEIKLPFELFLKQLNLSDINFILEPDSPADNIESIQLRADLINSRLTLHQLTTSIPQLKLSHSPSSAQADIHGYVDLTSNYPLSLQSELTLDLTQLLTLRNKSLQSNQLTLKGNITGDLSALHINQTSNGLLNASITAQINHLLGDVDWKTDIQVTQLPIELLTPEGNQNLMGETITGQLNASGDLNQAGGIVEIQLPKTLDHGMIKLDGVVSWKNTLKWQASLETRQINPGIFYSEWPAILDINLHTDGQLSEDQFSAAIQLDKLSGYLRDQPLAGSGQFHIDNNMLSIHQLILSSGDAEFKANGELGDSGEKVNLNWSLDIKQLSDLLPDAQGSINGQGQIKGIPGNKGKPQIIINSQLKLVDVIYQTNHLSQADIKLSLNSDPEKQSDIDINAQSLIIDSQEIKSFKFNLTGPLQKHQLKINIEHELAKLSLGASGRFDIEQFSWAGQIKKIIINSTSLGQWQQQKAASLFASADKIALSTLCLKDISENKSQKQKATLCTHIDWALFNNSLKDQSPGNKTQSQGQAGINLNKLSFERFKPYIPEEITHLTGELDIKADIDFGSQLLAQIKAEIKPGELKFQPLTQKAVTITHRNGLITANYNKQKLQAHWNIDMSHHSINGGINIPRKAIEKDPLSAPIDGHLNVNIKDLDILSILVPQISDAKGHINAQLKLKGLLGTPRVTGHADFTADYLSIRDIGIRIEDIKINLRDKNNGQALALLGSLNSGDGQIELNGLVTLDAEQGWPVDIDFKGNDFLAINTPDVYAVISPAIQFRQEKGLMHLKGKILLPEATLSPATIPEGSVSVSDDVEILGIEKEPEANLDLNITIVLGEPDNRNKVKLDAFGLKTDLSGELTINQRPRQLMTAHGELHLHNGTFRAYGQDLTIDKGSIFYAGGYIDNPGIKLTASRQIAETKVGIKVTGSVKKPKVNTFSNEPGLESKDIISMMLTGQKVDNLENARIYAGTEIGKGLSVGVNAGVGDEGSEFVTRFKLTDKIQLEGTSSATKSGGNIIYTFEVE